jgi:PhoD-like phosphatase
MALPFILAGPILRRVDPEQVCVWVALSQPRTIVLQVWEGEVRGNGGLPFPLHLSQVTHTLRVGANLHIAAVSLIPDPPLNPGTFYSYNLVFNDTDDFVSLGLLNDKVGPPEQLALGYETGALPGFYTPPTDITNLKIIHGSCRKLHGHGKDTLAPIDDYIKKNRTEANQRPHYLFLTGDQIYADDVGLAVLPMLTQAGIDVLGLTERIPTSGATPDTDLIQKNFPAGRRDKLMSTKAKFTSSDENSHLIGFGEFCAMYLFSWSNTLWPAVLPSKTDVVTLAMDTNIPTNSLLTDIANTTDDPKRNANFKKDLEDQWDKQLKQVQEFQKRLTRVRRMLANVPVFMICDDHEITDDWNITREWRDRVFTAPLGVTVLRNGLAAYTLFQAWGNDPNAFQGGANMQALQQAANLYQGGALDQNAADSLATLFGLGGAAPQVKLHYSITGGQYEIVVLDTRTHRTYPTRTTPPGLLDNEALEEQIPELPQSQATQLLIVISAAPVLGLPVFEELGQPAGAAVIDAINTFGARMKDRNAPADALRAQLTGAFALDLEAWGFNPAAFEALLARLQPHHQVLILAGDVHYGFTAHLDYWKQGEPKPTRIVQAVASSFQNQIGPALQFLLGSARLQQVFGEGLVPAERFGWKNNLVNLNPFNIPAGKRLPLNQRARLHRTPLVVTKEGMPVGTTLNTPPEWKWRLQIEVDERPDDSSPNARPEAVRIKSLTPDVNFANAADGYVSAVRRYAGEQEKSNSRRVVWNTNYGLIHFESDAGTLVVFHDLYYEVEDEADAFTSHRVPLATPSTVTAPQF